MSESYTTLGGEGRLSTVPESFPNVFVYGSVSTAGVSNVSLESVILGTADADLVLRGGQVLSTNRRELVTGSLAVVDGRVAGIHDEPEAVSGPETRVIDVDGGIVVPGLIDAHTHLDLHQAFERAYPYALASGTTSLVSEVAAFGPAFGADGVDVFLESTADLPVRVFATVPPQRYFDMFDPPRGTDADRDRLRSLLDRDRVVGVGETAWIRIVGREGGATPLYERAAALGKTVSGHGAGVSGRKLQAFGSVVTDDHEAIAADGICYRVSAGIHPIGRFGSIRDDMDALVEAAASIDTSELSLSTDGMWPRELVEKGHMDAVLRRAIEGGLDPVDAVVMATLTPARHFGLDGLGSLAPGTPADVVVLSDLEEPTVEWTIVDGAVVFDGERVPTTGPNGLESPTPHTDRYEYPEWMRTLPTLSFGPSDFEAQPPDGNDEAVRAIEYRGGLLTGETTVTPQREGGTLRPDPAEDILSLSLHDRAPDGDRGGFTGFVTGFGVESGAVATTVTWETPGLLVLGTGPEEMARAANRLVDLDGGWVVVDSGEVLAELPTPIGATCAATDPAETAERYAAVESAVRELGATVDRPLLGLQTIAFVGVPSLKMAFSGYADIRAGEVVGLEPPGSHRRE